MTLSERAKIAAAVAGVLVGTLFVLAQPIPALDFQAHIVLGSLLGAICWWIGGVLPEYATALVMAILVMLLADVPVDIVFGAFSTSTWWLLLAAFALGFGMKKSGLMKRMALSVLRVFPRTFAAQAFALMAAGTCIGPLIPSLTAKAAILAPLSLSISDSLGFERKGKQANGLFLAMFVGVRNIAPAVVSASVVGYAVLSMYPVDVQAEFDMLTWFLSALPWFVVVMVLTYGALLLMYAPRGAKGTSANTVPCAGAGAGAGVSPSESTNSRSSGATSSKAKASGTESFKSNASRAKMIEEGRSEEQLGPMSATEKRMLVIILLTVALWVCEPLHGIPAHVVALAAFVAMIPCRIIEPAELRTGISWETLLFIGIVIGLSGVFDYAGINQWIVAAFGPVFESLAQNPYLFVMGIAVMTVLLRFVIVSELAYLGIFLAFMVPLAAQLGISPWIVGFAMYALVNPWFVPYQNPVYIAALGAVDGVMTKQSEMAKYCAVYVLICMLGLVISVPYWQMLGMM